MSGSGSSRRAAIIAAAHGDQCKRQYALQPRDREAATVQGLTHLIAKVLVQMEPLPTRMTTTSFDLLVEAVSLVRHDAPEVFEAIERSNPYSQQVRRRFFDLASALDAELTAIPHSKEGRFLR